MATTHEDRLRKLCACGHGELFENALTDAESAACLAGAEALRLVQEWHEAREVFEANCGADLLQKHAAPAPAWPDPMTDDMRGAIASALIEEWGPDGKLEAPAGVPYRAMALQAAATARAVMADLVKLREMNDSASLNQIASPAPAIGEAERLLSRGQARAIHIMTNVAHARNGKVLFACDGPDCTVSFRWRSHQPVCSNPVTKSAWKPSMSVSLSEDVNLIDFLEYIADCTMAGMARSGSVRPLVFDPALLVRAAENTAAMLKAQVVVEDEE